MLGTRHASERRRVLVVNCYLDDTRASVGRAAKVPPAMAPAYLAGTMSPERCDVRLYNEQTSGPLEDERLLAWPDMLVLSGLTQAVDRMRHLTAYARTKNPRVIVVAGGHAVRALPRYCRRIFDYCCLGDIEELGEVVADAFGASYAAGEVHPRFDLTQSRGPIGYLEASRHCNFRCAFCTLTAEGRRYQPTGAEDLRRQILSLGRRRYLVFVDNNFYGNDRRNFLERLDVLRELWRAGYFRSWGALVSGDFFLDDANLARVREAGCGGLFSGVEAFDADWLRRNNKRQNTRVNPAEPIRRTLEAGMGFFYGLVFDATTRRLADMRRELDLIVDNPAITLPAYVVLSIPLLKTPFFYDCLRNGLILPKTRIRDLDGTTLSLRPLDPVEDIVAFVKDLRSLRGYRRRVFLHSARFALRYRSALPLDGLALALSNAALLCAPFPVDGPTRYRGLRVPRTHVSTTDVLDRVYRPAFPVDPRYADYFAPALLTDAAGDLAADVADDLMAGA